MAASISYTCQSCHSAQLDPGVRVILLLLAACNGRDLIVTDLILGVQSAVIVTVPYGGLLSWFAHKSRKLKGAENNPLYGIIITGSIIVLCA